MTPSDRLDLRIAVEESIRAHFAKRRELIDGFCGSHFVAKHVFEIQKSLFWRDILRSPLNALWSIPYLAIKQILEPLAKLGVSGLREFIAHMPAGWKTSYQKSVEASLADELFGLPLDGSSTDGAFFDEIRNHPVIKSRFADLNLRRAPFKRVLAKELDGYTADCAIVSDLASSLGALVAGWVFFGNGSLGVSGMGQSIAGRYAREDAVSTFALGRDLGDAFYSIFPAEPTHSEVAMATAAVGTALVVFSWVVSAGSDPLRTRIGLQQQKLKSLTDSIEKALIAQVSALEG